MKVSVDLHIHSALSPCGDKEMTPNNIVGMASLKGLDIIALTDHNSMENVEATIKVGRKNDILVVPGIEVTTKEDIHVLCYFPNIKDGLKFQNVIYKGLPDIKNQEAIFGSQIIYDEKDHIKGKFDRFLIHSTRYSLKEIYDLTHKNKGVMVPAHINKGAYSLLSVLGFLPTDIKIKTMELASNCRDDLLPSNINNGNYKLLVNSDAHYLKEILEPIQFLDVKEKSASSLLDFFKQNSY